MLDCVVPSALDVVAVVVSEERGELAIAASGRMLSGLDERRLREQLYRLFAIEPVEAERAERVLLDGRGE